MHTIFASLARTNERATVHNITDFPQAKLDSEINARFQLNEHRSDLEFLFNQPYLSTISPCPPTTAHQDSSEFHFELLKTFLTYSIRRYVIMQEYFQKNLENSLVPYIRFNNMLSAIYLQSQIVL